MSSTDRPLRTYPWEVMAGIARHRAIPIVRERDRRQGLDQCRRLIDAGAAIVEVSFTTPAAAALIAEVVGDVGDSVLVGAGTVLDAATARLAIDAGAQFLLAPGLAPEMICTGQRYGVAVIPAAQTATEAMTAMELGATAVKLFPASSVGIGGMRSIAEALPHVPFIPTGGVRLDAAAEWLDAGAIAVGLGGAASRAGDDELRTMFAALERHQTTRS